MFNVWSTPEAAATALGAIATLLAGLFVIVGAIVAWFSVQRQIRAAEGLERQRVASEMSTLKSGFIADMLVYSTGIIESLSQWNQRSFIDSGKVEKALPVFPNPLFYRANITKIGALSPLWVGAAIIGFYANLLELDEQSRESIAGRPTANMTNESIAKRLRKMAANLSQALDGLSGDREFPLVEMHLDEMFMPDGRPVSTLANAPTTLQNALMRLAGQEPRPAR
jgi:hypothetical protein